MSHVLPAVDSIHNVSISFNEFNYIQYIDHITNMCENVHLVIHSSSHILFCLPILSFIRRLVFIVFVWWLLEDYQRLVCIVRPHEDFER